MGELGVSPPRAFRVLLADDSATLRSLVAVELEEAGYEVVEAEDGLQALERAAEGDVDILLLDIEMPVMNGYETLRRLKASEELRDLPVVFLTGREGSEALAEALHLGAHDYLRKPPEPVELIARVAAACRVKALQDQLRQRAAELEAMSRTDFLTGLHNRRHMEEELHAALARAHRSGKSCGLLIIDVDHFKRVNDTLGHEAGDAVLQEVAERLRRGVREVDAVGRWGGEEFLIVMGDATPADVESLAERLRLRVADAPAGATPFPCSVSISLGGAVSATATAPDLLRAADDNLYAAKEAGRNQWRVCRA